MLRVVHGARHEVDRETRALFDQTETAGKFDREPPGGLVERVAINVGDLRQDGA